MATYLVKYDYGYAKAGSSMIVQGCSSAQDAVNTVYAVHDPSVPVIVTEVYHKVSAKGGVWSRSEKKEARDGQGN